jgi:hypothetical protein
MTCFITSSLVELHQLFLELPLSSTLPAYATLEARFGTATREGHGALTEFGEEEGEDEPDGPSSDDEHRQMRRVASASPAGEGREGRVLSALEPPDRAPVSGEEAPAAPAGDRRHRFGRLGLRRRRRGNRLVARGGGLWVYKVDTNAQ